MPKFPVTTLPNAGPNGIRVKLLVEMNCLGKTQGKYGCDSSSLCPYGFGEEEDEAHFLLRCVETATARRELMERIGVSCSCLTRLGAEWRGPSDTDHVRGERGTSTRKRKRPTRGPNLRINHLSGT